MDLVTGGEPLGYVAVFFVLVTFWMKTMIPLRVVGLISNVLFIGYGYLDAAYPPLVLHIVLLPLNFVRLREMLRLTRRVKAAARGDLDMEWLKPFTASRMVQSGERIFDKGDAAEDMFYVASGRYRLAETGMERGPGDMLVFYFLQLTTRRLFENITELEQRLAETRASYERAKAALGSSA